MSANVRPKCGANKYDCWRSVGLVNFAGLTKIDETTRPGALVEIAAESNLPLVYLCNGQRVPEDLQSATPEFFVARILNSANSFAQIS